MTWKMQSEMYFQLAWSIGSASRSGRTDALMKGVGLANPVLTVSFILPPDSNHIS
jgi:hypothetical protein